MRGIYKGLGVAALIGALAAPFAVERYPDLQTIKNIPGKAGLSFLVSDPRYSVVNNAVDAPDLEPIQKPWTENERDTLEQKIGELFVTRSNNFENVYPGGVLLSKNETERGNLRGLYTSYDPERTQRNIQSILDGAASANKRILIYDEGEGGYVSGIGVLPAAKDIGDYYSNNVLGVTIKDKVIPSRNKSVRRDEVRRLFEEYAKELQNRGVDSVFGPVLDVVHDDNEGNNMKKADRNFSDSHLETREIARLYIRAMHDQGIRVTGKHYLSNGIVENGDPHFEEVPSPANIVNRRRALETYRVLGNQLDAVMVTHTGNSSDNQRPWSLSRRAYDSLIQERYSSASGSVPQVFLNNRVNGASYRGANFDGFVITDGLSMKAITDYINRNELSQRGKRLVEGCNSEEGRAAVIAIAQGANGIILTGEKLDTAVACMVNAYNQDSHFKTNIERSFRRYEMFAGRTK